jgi:hypothetical protein
MKDLHADRDFQSGLFIIWAASVRKKEARERCFAPAGSAGETLLSVSLSISCFNSELLNHFSKKKNQASRLIIVDLFVP